MEDNQLVLQRMKELLHPLPSVRAMYSCSDPAAALALFEEQKPDIAILDINVPATGGMRNGLDVLKAIKSRDRACIAIIMTVHAEPIYRERSHQLGADYFMDKSEGFEQLPELIAQIKVDKQGRPVNLPNNLPPSA